MVVLWSLKETDSSGEEYDAPIPEGSTCYACGGELVFPIVLWYGCGEGIWFHPACARRWLLSFSRDVWEVTQTLDDGKWGKNRPANPISELRRREG